MNAHHADAHVADFAGEADRCTRCGACQTVCPVHGLTATESTCSRGKVFLARELEANRLEPSREIQEIVSTCLLCKACRTRCPSGVATDALFMRLRRVLAEDVGLPWVKRIAFSALTYRALFDLGLRLGPAFQNLVLKDAPDGRGGKISRVPLPAAGLNLRRVLPALAPRPLRALLGGKRRRAAPKTRVALFPGCMLNYVYPQAGKAIVDVLSRHGAEIVVPRGLGCCGVPATANGDFAAGGFLAANNVRALVSGGFDAVVTGCASCGAALRDDYDLVLPDGPEREAWEGLRKNVFDFTELLLRLGFPKAARPGGIPKTTVTYHDPCHLVRGMGVSAEPRQVLAGLPGVEFAEMAAADTCCGCGGTFSLTRYELAREINDAKVANIEATGAETLVTGCSACRMHINDGLSRRQGSARVLHTAQLVAMAYAD